VRRGIGRVAEGVARKLAHEFAEIDVGDPGVAADDKHVFMISFGARFAENRRTGNDDRIVGERIDQHEFGMDPLHIHAGLHSLQFL
jgi:hypothetical protein